VTGFLSLLDTSSTGEGQAFEGRRESKILTHVVGLSRLHLPEDPDKNTLSGMPIVRCSSNTAAGSG
jgi:hypothetical protein